MGLSSRHICLVPLWPDRPSLRATRRVVRLIPKPVRGKDAAGRDWTASILPPPEHWQTLLSRGIQSVVAYLPQVVFTISVIQ